MLHFQRALAQDFEAAPGGLVVRDRVGLEPLAVHEPVEVGTGGDGGVQIGIVERDQRGLDLRLIKRRLGIGGGGRRGIGLATGGQRHGDGDGQAQRDQLGKLHSTLRLQMDASPGPRAIGQRSAGGERADRPKVTHRERREALLAEQQELYGEKS